MLDDGDARYVYGAAGLISQVTVADTYYYLPDGLGSTMVTTDSAGNVANAYTYDVFGASRSQSGAQANEFQFAGEQVDGSTGLQYLRARYYDFETGRFISREPLANLPGWGDSGYSYARSNPLRFIDRDGLRIVDVDACEPSGRSCEQGTSRTSSYDGVYLPGGFFQVTDDGHVQMCAYSQWPRDPVGTHFCEDFDPTTWTAGPRGEAWFIDEYVQDFVRGCKADPAFCAASLGTQAAAQLMQWQGGALVLGGIACSTGVGCGVMVITGGAIWIAGGQIRLENLREIRRRGEGERREGGRSWQ